MPRVMNNNDLESIKNSISRYLSMREHSKQELVDKLLKKDYEKDLIMQCIEEFSEKDLQSDYRYAESFARAKFNDHKGENFIRISLRNKGISSDLINEIMQGYDDQAWLKQAISALEKKVFKSFKSVIDKRKNDGLVVDAKFIGMRDIRIVDASFSNKTMIADVTLSFKSEISIVVMNKKGAVIEGHPDDIKKQKDTWVFTKNLSDQSPMWLLKSTL